ncbi:MAG TPA: magnesium/cobalt transporter CorA [Chitinophagales bacterium]|nr:magnesium/cobalt transporter CorA [Chitinophagales bacterium]
MTEAEIKANIPLHLPSDEGSKKVGLPPGSLVYIGPERTHKPKITLFNYTPERYIEKTVDSIEECLPFKDEKSVTWVNVDGVHYVELIEKIGSIFELHPLLLEDVVNTHQRPKMDEFDDHLFMVLRMLTYDEEKKCIASEQVSIVLSKKFVISFQEDEGDLYDPIRARIRDNKSRIRDFGTDYLVYRIMDVTVDHYFVLMEKLGEKIEHLEEKVLHHPPQTILEEIQNLKKDLILMRRSVYPLREVLAALTRDDNKLILKKTQKFIRDVHDHTVQVIETLEMFRETVNGLKEAYHSHINIEMNKTIQTLTIITTVFIPLSFIASIYGMNFKYMPELESHYGYPAVIVVMACVAILMMIFFRRRKWL